MGKRILAVMIAIVMLVSVVGSVGWAATIEDNYPKSNPGEGSANCTGIQAQARVDE